MRPARGHRAFPAHSHPNQHRRSRSKTCLNLVFTLCFLTLAAVWIYFIAQTNSSSALPHSLYDMEILWETKTLGEDLCHSRLRHSGILEEGKNVATATTSRHRLYRAMNNSLSEGLQLSGGAVQGKGVDEFFTIDSTTGKIKPVLHPLPTPVRAIVLPLLELELAWTLQEAVIQHLVPLFPANTLWLQNSELLHTTIYHASSHMDPVPATAKQIDSEILSIVDVAERLCPIDAILESVVITRSGTVLALWQPAPGSTEPAQLRKNLFKALPGASKKQVVTDTVLLHTTLARIATDSNTKDQGKDADNQLEQGQQLPSKEALWTAVGAITRKFCGTQTRMDALWYVEEEDLLALALNGRIKKRTIPFQCKQTQYKFF